MGDISKGEGRTVLFVSHNMAAIFALCKKCILLNNGTIEKNDTTQEVIDYYKSQISLQSKGEIKINEVGFSFLGIKNKDSLNNLRVSDNIVLELTFCTNIYLNNVYIDIGIYNNDEIMIIHSKAKFISNGIKLDKDKETDILYEFQQPNLTPGDYFMTLYVYTPDKIVYWADHVPVFNIGALNGFENSKTLILDGLRGLILPKISITNKY